MVGGRSGQPKQGTGLLAAVEIGFSVGRVDAFEQGIDGALVSVGGDIAAAGAAPNDLGCVPSPDPDAPTRYRHLHQAMLEGLVRSCHDVSEGGLAVALAEMCIAGRLGAEITELPHEHAPAALFPESQSRLIVEIAPTDLDRFRDVMHETVHVLGTVIEDDVLVLPGVEPIRIEDLVDAFQRVSVPGPIPAPADDADDETAEETADEAAAATASDEPEDAS